MLPAAMGFDGAPFIGALACVFMIVKYDSINKSELSCVTHTLFDMKGGDCGTPPSNERDVPSELKESIQNNHLFNHYYESVEKEPLLSHPIQKESTHPPQGDLRLVSAIVCLDLLRDLSLLTNLNNYNFIANHFFYYHQQEMDIDVFNQLRNSDQYRCMRKHMSLLLTRRLVHLRRVGTTT
jgi:hypothetical protein